MRSSVWSSLAYTLAIPGTYVLIELRSMHCNKLLKMFVTHVRLFSPLVLTEDIWKSPYFISALVCGTLLMLIIGITMKAAHSRYEELGKDIIVHIVSVSTESTHVFHSILQYLKQSLCFVFKTLSSPCVNVAWLLGL